MDGPRKVDNPEVWEKIKSGEAKGLSIEGWFKDEIVEMSKQKATKPSVWKQLYNKVTGRNFYAEARLGDGTVVVTEAESFGSGRCRVHLGRPRTTYEHC